MQNKYWLIGIFTILLISNIYAAQICWERINCESSGPITSGATIAIDYEEPGSKKEEYCILDGLTGEIGSAGIVEIVIHQGQYQGGDSDIKRIVVDKDFVDNGIPIVFKMSKDTSPTTIICNDIYPSSGAGQPYTVIRSLNYWSASYDQQWYTNKAGIPEYMGFFKHYLDDFETSISVNDTNITKTYNNVPADTTNWFMYGIAWFFILIGLLIIFQSVTMYNTKRR